MTTPFPASRSGEGRLWSVVLEHDSDLPDRGIHDLAPISALVERLRRGEVAAIEVLYRQHQECVRAFATRLLGDAHAAEDLVHDVFVAAPAAFRRYHGDATVRTFLLSIATNHARHYVRSAARRRAALHRLADHRAQTRELTPADAAQRSELAEELLRALDQLPVDQRIVVVLCEVEERSASEVGQIVGAPEATVRTRLFHAKRKLRALLGAGP
jgi:RNA polymerase sigma-70 factor (ECF subfamily)